MVVVINLSQFLVKNFAKLP